MDKGVHAIRSVYPPHGQWPAPMGGWRVLYTRLFSSLYSSVAIRVNTTRQHVTQYSNTFRLDVYVNVACIKLMNFKIMRN